MLGSLSPAWHLHPASCPLTVPVFIPVPLAAPPTLATVSPPVPPLQEPSLSIPTLLPGANISGRQRPRPARWQVAVMCLCPRCTWLPTLALVLPPACLPACSGAQFEPGAGGCGSLPGAPLRPAGAAGAAGRRARQHCGRRAPLDHAGALACRAACTRAMFQPVTADVTQGCCLCRHTTESSMPSTLSCSPSRWQPWRQAPQAALPLPPRHPRAYQLASQTSSRVKEPTQAVLTLCSETCACACCLLACGDPNVLCLLLACM